MKSISVFTYHKIKGVHDVALLDAVRGDVALHDVEQQHVVQHNRSIILVHARDVRIFHCSSQKRG